MHRIIIVLALLIGSITASAQSVYYQLVIDAKGTSGIWFEVTAANGYSGWGTSESVANPHIPWQTTLSLTEDIPYELTVHGCPGDSSVSIKLWPNILREGLLPEDCSRYAINASGFCDDTYSFNTIYADFYSPTADTCQNSTGTYYFSRSILGGSSATWAVELGRIVSTGSKPHPTDGPINALDSIVVDWGCSYNNRRGHVWHYRHKPALGCGTADATLKQVVFNGCGPACNSIDPNEYPDKELDDWEYVLECDEVTGADSYVWYFDPAYNDYLPPFYHTTTTTELMIGDVPFLNPVRLYNLRVAPVIAGVQQPWGLYTTVQTPADPSLAITSAFCADTATSIHDFLVATPVPDAIEYRWILSHNGQLDTVTTDSNAVPLSAFQVADRTSLQQAFVWVWPKINNRYGSNNGYCTFHFAPCDPVIPGATVNTAPCLGGTATLSASGGTPPYSYAWPATAGGGTSATANNLPTGGYSATITDAIGCWADTLVAVAAATVAPTLTASSTPGFCGQSDGTTTVAATGALAPYTFAWDAAAFNQTTAIATGLAGGSYHCTVADANGCTTEIAVAVNPSTELEVTSSTTGTTCPSAADGSATAVPVGGAAPFTYSWDAFAHSATGATVSTLYPGNYAVSVVDANGCAGSATVSVAPPDVANTGTQLNSTWCGATNVGQTASITSNYVAGVERFQYEFLETNTGALTYGFSHSSTPTSTSFSLNFLSGVTWNQNYLVRVRYKKNGCWGAFGPACPLDIEALPTTQLNSYSCGREYLTNSSTSVEINTVPGATRYEYEFSNDDGFYATGLSHPLDPTGNYFSMYYWLPGLRCGTQYNVRVRVQFGTVWSDWGPACSITTAPNHVVMDGPILDSVSHVDQTCHNQGINGSATAHVSDGNAPLSYQWSQSTASQTTQTATGLWFGQHLVTVTDNRGCSTVGGATLDWTGSPTWTTIDVVPATCAGNDGGATFNSMSGGTAPYTFTWAGGSSNGSSTLSGMYPGTYDISVGDINGCERLKIGLVIPGSDPTNTGTILQAAYCDDTLATLGGYIHCASAPGAERYQYLWRNTTTGATASGFSTSSAPTSTFFAPTWVSGIDYNTTYEVRVRYKKNGCWGAFGTTCLVTTPAEPTTQLNSTWCGASLTSINTNTYINAVAGAQRYQYEITDGGSFSATTFSPSYAPTSTWLNLSLVAGIQCGTVYNIRVRQKISGVWGTYGPVCTLTTPTADPVFSGLTLDNINVIDDACSAGLGAATAVVSGGIDPIGYQWDAGTGNQTNGMATFLHAGTYFVTVSDNAGCSASGTATVNDVPGPTLAGTGTTGAGCAVNNGTATIALLGGNLPYTYAWDLAAGNQSAATATGLAPGSYNVTATDANGCSITASEVVSVTASPPTLSTSMTTQTCVDNDGTATVTASGGLSPYTYAWDSNASNQTTATATGLSAGPYDATVTDANGCSASANAVVGQTFNGPGGTVSTTDESCTGGDGSATMTASSGIAPYTFLWDAPAGNQTTATASNLIAGNYSVTVTDNAGCTATATANVVATLTSPTLNHSSTTAQCGPTGTATIIASGTSGPYSYLWDATAASQTAATATALTSGYYSVTVADGAGCTEQADSIYVDYHCATYSGLARNRIACGAQHAVLLCHDGEVWTIGSNSVGQRGTYTNYNESPAQVVLPLPATEVAASDYHSFALLEDGTVWGWGSDDYILGRPAPYNSFAPPGQVVRDTIGYPVLTGIQSIVAGPNTCMALDSLGNVWSWSGNSSGTYALKVPLIDQVVQLDLAQHTLALRQDGTVWSWGNNSSGQLGRGWGNNSNTGIPTQIAGLSNIVRVSVGANHSVALDSDGLLWSWGSTVANLQGISPSYNLEVPIQHTGFPTANRVSAGYAHTFTIAPDSTVWAAGYNGNNALGTTDPNAQVGPAKQITTTTGRPLESVVAVYSANSSSQTYALRSDGSIWGWGNSYSFETVLGTSSLPIPDSIGTGCSIFQPACYHLDLGAAYTLGTCGGSNGSIQLNPSGIAGPFSYQWSAAAGGGTASSASGLAVGPYDITVSNGGACVLQTSIYMPSGCPLAPVQNKAAGGNSYSAVICSDSTVWTCGLSPSGQLGNGADTNSYVPVQSLLAGKAVSLANATSTQYALLDDGTVWRWGQYALPVNGVPEESNVPVQVMTEASGQLVPFDGVVQVAANQYPIEQAYALRSDGTVWMMMGDLDFFAPYLDVLHATELEGLHNIVSISCGSETLYCLRSDGTLWMIGQSAGSPDTYGGPGPAIRTATPVHIDLGAPVREIYAASGAQYAVLTDGSVVTWEPIYYPSYNPTSNAPFAHVASVPVRITAFDHLDVQQFSANSIYLTALLTNGRIMRWADSWYNVQVADPNVTGYTNDKPVTPVGFEDSYSLGAFSNIRSVSSDSKSVIWAFRDDGMLISNAATRANGDGHAFDPDLYWQAYYEVPMPVPCTFTPAPWDTIHVDATSTAAACGDADGTATVNAYGDGPFSYEWSGNAFSQTTASATGLPAGTYSVTVEDAFGLTVTNTLTVDSICITAPRLTKVSTAGTRTFAICEAGNLYQLAPDNYTQHQGVDIEPGTFFQVELPQAVRDIQCTIYRLYVLFDDGTVSSYNSSAQQNTEMPLVDSSGTPLQDIVNIAVHDGWGYAMKRSGQIWYWGSLPRQFGQYGNSAQARPLMDINARAVAVGHYSSMFLFPDSTVWGFGSLFNALNDPRYPGDVNFRDIKKVDVADVVQIASGHQHYLALTADGLVYGWGHNAQGQTGTGTFNNLSTPTLIPGLTNVVEIRAGKNHSAARTANGMVYTWGNGAYRPLGIDPQPVTSNVPLLVTTTAQGGVLDNIVGIAAESEAERTYAIRSDGSLWGWGRSNAAGNAAPHHQLLPDSAHNLCSIGVTPCLPTNLDATVTHTACNTSLGSIATTLLGAPTSPTYSWSGLASGQNGPTVSGLPHGEYSVTVTDGNGCTSTDSWYIETDCPAPGSISTVAGFDQHTLAICSDSTLWVVGNNNSGMVNDPDYVFTDPVQIPVPSPVISVASGGFSWCVLFSDSTVGSWGTQYEGNLGNPLPGTTSAIVPVVTDSAATNPLTDVVALRHSGYIGAALRSDGTVWAWGRISDYATAPLPDFPRGIAQPIPGFTNITDIAIGPRCIYGIRADKTLWWYGIDGSAVTALTGPSQVPGIANVSKIVAGESRPFAVLEDGSVVSWDWHAYDNYLETSPFPNVDAIPVTIGSLSNVVDIAATSPPSVLLSDGIVYTFPLGSSDLLAPDPASGSHAIYPVLTPLEGTYDPNHWENTVELTDHWGKIVGIKNNGMLVSNEALTPEDFGIDDVYWANGRDSLELPCTVTPTFCNGLTLSLTAAPTTCISPVTSASVGTCGGSQPYTFAWDAQTGSQTSNPATGLPASTYTVTVTDAGGITAIDSISIGFTCLEPAPRNVVAGGLYHNAYLCENGQVWSSGSNNDRQLGNGSNTNTGSVTPIETALPGQAAELAANSYGGHALLADGTVWGWGTNAGGLLGSASAATNANAPEQVVTDAAGTQALANIVQIASASTRAMALDSSGTIWVWGKSSSGEIPGDSSNKAVPITTISNVVYIACGTEHMLAAKADGTVWAWGANTNGTLGDGTNANATSPVQVAGISNPRMLAANAQQSFALLQNGDVWGWGGNAGGTLALGPAISNTNVPINIDGLSNITEIRAAEQRLIALNAVSQVLTLGDGTLAGLGVDPPVTAAALPITVSANASAGTLASIKRIGIGQRSGQAIAINGSAWAWGRDFDTHGSLGVGVAGQRLAPDSVHLSCSMAIFDCPIGVPLMTSTPSGCQLLTGTASAVPAVGSQPYTYLWSDNAGQTTQTATGLYPTSYTVSITDVSGCVQTGTVDVQTYLSIPSTQLNPASCGITLTSLTQYLFNAGSVNPERYEYEITDDNGFFALAYSASTNPNSPLFSMSWVPGVQLATTYHVRVRVKKHGCWGQYGASCDVTTPAGVPETQLAAASCNSTLTALNDYFYCNPVQGAQRYQYEITDGNGFVATPFSLSSSPTGSFFSFYFVPGITFGVTYNVRVRAKVGGIWGNWGPVCTLSMPAPLIPQINPQHCGTTVNAMSDYFYAVSIPNADRYQYEFTDGGSFLEYAFSYWGAPSSTWMSFALVPGIQTATTYTVRVRTKIGGVWGTYGPPCDLTTPATAAKLQAAAAEPYSSTTEPGFRLFPNPASERITVLLPVPHDHQSPAGYSVTLRNALGAIVRTYPRTREGDVQMQLDVMDLPIGVYTLCLHNDAMRMCERVVIAR